uniref:WD_REPEATS_REGION domain-containing protein n=1 Tax=Macrostomum lignano TaxID=282301 RepID=A0A1I8F557_9PLAT
MANVLATCSSDQTVKVWDLDSDGEWKLTCSWRAHNGSIWRLAWAHPEFDPSASGREVTTTAPSAGVGVASIGIGGGRQRRQAFDNDNVFEKRAHLVESALSVTGIQFAPRHPAAQTPELPMPPAKTASRYTNFKEDSRKFAQTSAPAPVARGRYALSCIRILEYQR